MLRMADLGKQDGRAHLSEGVSETEDEATSEVDLPISREAGDEGASNHDGTTGSDGNLTTNGLGEEGDQEEADNTANVVGVVHETEAVVVGVIEVDSPAGHLLGRVHHHTSKSGQSRILVVSIRYYSPIVSSGSRGNTENASVEVKLSHVG
jgi:hypothetical protein